MCYAEVDMDAAYADIMKAAGVPDFVIPFQVRTSNDRPFLKVREVVFFLKSLLCEAHDRIMV